MIIFRSIKLLFIISQNTFIENLYAISHKTFLKLSLCNIVQFYPQLSMVIFLLTNNLTFQKQLLFLILLKTISLINSTQENLKFQLRKYYFPTKNQLII